MKTPDHVFEEDMKRKERVVLDHYEKMNIKLRKLTTAEIQHLYGQLKKFKKSEYDMRNSNRLAPLPSPMKDAASREDE